MLVCCGLSSVRNLFPAEEQKKEISTAINFCLENSLSIYDFLWFEKLIKRLKTKFSSLVLEGLFVTDRDTEFFDNVLEFFLSFYSEDQETFHESHGLADEYLSSPHKCTALSDNRLPVEYDVPYLSDVLDEALTNSCWMDVSRDWKISVTKTDNSVLIGMLCISQTGIFYISDDTCKLPVVMGPTCPDCTNEKSILKKLDDSDTALIVGCYDYDVILENLYCRDGSRCFQYIRTSCCRLFLLDSNNKLRKEVTGNLNKISLEGFVNEVKDDSNIHEATVDINQNQSDELVSFLVLSKLWYSIGLKSLKALVLFHPEESCIANNISETEIVPEDSFNFYETEDDFEFASLVDKLGSLCIEEKSRLGQLCFESEKFCRHLLPKQIYTIDVKHLHFKTTISQDSLLDLKVSSGAKIIHSKYLADTDSSPGLVKSCSVKEILLSKKVPQNCFVQGVLVDKLYKVSTPSFNGKSKESQTASLCLVIKDTSSSDTIPVYVPAMPKTTTGLLPGVHLELYGFFCTCSRNGTYYLKATNAFGIEIAAKANLFCSTVRDSFSSQCFIVKILSACIFSICHVCSRNFKESCFCLDSQVHIKVSALIDNGCRQSSMFCYGDTARKILGLQEKEWNSLSSFIEQHHKTLQFSDKMNDNHIRYFPIMNQIFFYYCTSKSIYRQLHLECVDVINTVSNRIDMPTVWCKRVLDYTCNDIMTKLYLKLKQ